MIGARIDWDVVDWQARDVDIARNCGCSRERVRQVRRQRGIAPSPNEHNSPGGIAVREFFTSDLGVAGRLTDEEIQARIPFKIHKNTIGAIRRSLGIPFPKPWWHELTLDVLKSKVQINDAGCWILNTQVNAYARIGSRYGHHVAYELVNGPVPEGLWVLHTCDTTSCVNPEHLYAGTPRQNVLDAINRGHRNGRLISELASVSAETQEKIKERRREGDSIACLARLFKIKEVTVRRIVADVKWSLPQAG